MKKLKGMKLYGMDESTNHSVIEAQINHVLLFGIVLTSHSLILNWEPKVRILISALKIKAATGFALAWGRLSPSKRRG